MPLEEPDADSSSSSPAPEEDEGADAGVGPGALPDSVDDVGAGVLPYPDSYP